MRTAFALVLAGALGCTASGPGPGDPAPPVTPSQPVPQPGSKPVTSAITVHMTAATLADDCGGGPSTPPQVRSAAREQERGDESRQHSRSKRACEQSSMQLAIAAPVGVEPAELSVKSVELLHESGATLGKLEARAPSLWSETEGYMPWNQSIEPAQELSVSYALSQPDWSQVQDRWNQTYTVKAVLSIGGADQAVQQRVEAHAPTSLPPNVRT